MTRHEDDTNHVEESVAVNSSNEDCNSYSNARRHYHLRKQLPAFYRDSRLYQTSVKESAKHHDYHDGKGARDIGGS